MPLSRKAGVSLDQRAVYNRWRRWSGTLRLKRGRTGGSPPPTAIELGDPSAAFRALISLGSLSWGSRPESCHLVSDLSSLCEFSPIEGHGGPISGNGGKTTTSSTGYSLSIF